MHKKKEIGEYEVFFLQMGIIIMIIYSWLIQLHSLQFKRKICLLIIVCDDTLNIYLWSRKTKTDEKGNSLKNINNNNQIPLMVWHPVKRERNYCFQLWTTIESYMQCYERPIAWSDVWCFKYLSSFFILKLNCLCHLAEQFCAEFIYLKKRETRFVLFEFETFWRKLNLELT